MACAHLSANLWLDLAASSDFNVYDVPPGQEMYH